MNETETCRQLAQEKDVMMNISLTADNAEKVIDCLNCPDETLDDYLVFLKHIFPGIYDTVMAASLGNFKQYMSERLYVYETISDILAKL